MVRYYRHKYGGYYSYLFDVFNTVDGSCLAIYSHVWPYAQDVKFARPMSEFLDGRFREVDEIEIVAAKKKDRMKAIEEIRRNKTQGNSVFDAGIESLLDI